MNQTNNLPAGLDSEFIEQLLADPKLFVSAARRGFWYFFYFFFGSYVEYPMAPFHQTMFRIAQDNNLKRACVLSFRSSAKSTILNTAYILWAIMGVQEKRHVVIASQTQRQARDHLGQIRREIEQNEPLRNFLGPFQETEDRWNSSVLIIPRYHARISTVSLEQEGIRGLREGPNLPDLIIVDDIEDAASAHTRELRDKTFRWITGELLTVGDVDTKVLFLGNFINDDCALMRIGKLLQSGAMAGEFHRIPLVDENDVVAWPGKYPDQASIEAHRRSLGNDVLWFREFLLKYVPEEQQIIKPEDIHYYDPDVTTLSQLTAPGGGLLGIGVDLAISQATSADFTTMVSGRVFYNGDIGTIYVLPEPVNQRLDFKSTLDMAQALNQAHPGVAKQFFVESNQYQLAAVQELERRGIPTIGMRAQGSKAVRLNIAATYIKNGTVLFPRTGCEKLIEQLLYFGIEPHDDLADALAYLILGLVEKGTLDLRNFKIWVI